MIVKRDEGVIHHEHWGDFDEDRISLVASSSKMITAGVLPHLDDTGMLDIDAPVADAVDWGTGNPNITPAQLISNSIEASSQLGRELADQLDDLIEEAIVGQA